MPRVIIFDNEKNTMFHHEGVTKYDGCQCFGDCGCSEDFKSQKYNYYSVLRKGKKTTHHENLESAIERWNFVNSLNETVKATIK